MPHRPLSLPQNTSKAPVSQWHATIRMVWIKSIFWHPSYSNCVSGRISKIQRNNGRRRWWTMATHLVFAGKLTGRVIAKKCLCFCWCRKKGKVKLLFWVGRGVHCSLRFSRYQVDQSDMIDLCILSHFFCGQQIQ